jgi:hypothetical protein
MEPSAPERFLLHGRRTAKLASGNNLLVARGHGYSRRMAKFPSFRNALLAAFTACFLLSESMGAAERSSLSADFAPDAETSWIPVGDDYLPPDSGPGPVTSDPAHPYVPNFTPGKMPTYRVADLSNPILQPWAKDQMRKANDDVLAGHVPFRARESCWPPGVPTFLVYALATPLYFLQAPNQVVITYSGGPELRQVYLGVPHSANPKPSWYGESVGHYEGDTLVVDTVALNPRTYVDNYRTPHTDQLHVVERYRLIRDGNMLEVRFIVEDPGAFTQAWSGIQKFRRSRRIALSELPCVESDAHYFSYETYPVPVSDKPDF